MFTYATGMGPNLKLPEAARQPAVLRAVFTARSATMGNRIVVVKAEDGIRPSNRFDWNIKCYTPKLSSQCGLGSMQHMQEDPPVPVPSWA